MSTAELRSHAKRMIEALPAAQLKVAATFLEFLDRKDSKAVAGGLVAAKMRRRIKAAEKDIAADRGVDWRKVRRDV